MAQRTFSLDFATEAEALSDIKSRTPGREIYVLAGPTLKQAVSGGQRWYVTYLRYT